MMHNEKAENEGSSETANNNAEDWSQVHKTGTRLEKGRCNKILPLLLVGRTESPRGGARSVSQRDPREVSWHDMLRAHL